MKKEKAKTLRRKLGQNTAEYLIMLVLIAMGSIGLFSLFGTTVRAHMSNVVAAFTGRTERLDPGDAAAKAKAIGEKKYDMNTSTQADDIEFTPQAAH